MPYQEVQLLRAEELPVTGYVALVDGTLVTLEGLLAVAEVEILFAVALQYDLSLLVIL